MSRILKILDSCIEFIGCICFAGMIVFLMANVFCDFAFGKRMAEIDEIVQSFFVWVTYVGAGLLYKNGEQMQIDFLADMLPPKIQKINNILVDLFTMLIAGVMSYYSWILSARSVVKMTPIARISYALIDFALVVGFFTMVLYIIVKLFHEIMGREGNKDD